jgi:hypothetical protein
MSMTIKLSGVKKFTYNLRALERGTWPAVVDALNVEAGQILKESQEFFVPIVTGRLRDSGYVTPARKGHHGNLAKVNIGYSAVYAAAVHENPRAGKTHGISPKGKYYKTWASTGGYKFLTRPLQQALPGMGGRLSRGIRAAWELLLR